MLQSTPMLSQQDSADTRACQRASASSAWTRTGMIDTSPIIAAVVRAYNDAHPIADVTPDAVLSPSRATHVAHARHLCAYLLVEDYHLSYMAAAHALGRVDHTTTLNSHARVVAALSQDSALQRALTGARDILSGRTTHERLRHGQDRREAFATATPQELAEYRYWRVQSLHSSAVGGV